MANSPTSRTLKLMRDKGYTSQVVEKFLVWTKQRVDLFYFGDVVSIKTGENGVLGIQATSTSNLAARRKKIDENEIADLWLSCGNRIWVIGWAKRGKQGKRKIWTAKIQEKRKDGKWYDVAEDSF